MENLKCLITNFPSDIFLALLLPLLLLLWWLSKQINRYKSHASELQDRINFLEGELEACRKSKVSGSNSANATVDVSGFKATIVGLEADLAACKKSGLAAAAAGAVVGAAAGTTVPVASIAPKTNKKDDLKVVEGIGPKIEGLCNAAGIYSFAQLAEASAGILKGILTEAGSRFQMHDPATWPAQAALARDAKWDELKNWQDDLNKGRA
jgi:predicted flap endonuclease-1-like 5' DNA nuclease